ncbi:MAG TPA: hypothetical protein VN157_06260 [Caulobacter sp.]|nr:hypothetical protein [Caulobacter sp.]
MDVAFDDRVTAIFAKGKYRSPRPAGASLSLPAQGIEGWAGHLNQIARIDDAGLRRAGGGSESSIPRASRGQGREVPGGAATVLSLPLDPHKALQSLTVRTTANEVVMGLMAATLERLL